MYDEEDASKEIATEKNSNEVTAASARASFSERTTAPDASNGYYYSNLNVFYSAGLAPGHYIDDYGNCTWYAWGRAYEILGTRPNLSVNQASVWYSQNETSGAYACSKNVPKVGAIACWSNHVAVVERVNADGTILLSESVAISGLSATGFLFKTRTESGSSPYNYGDTFYGYIYLGDFSSGGGSSTSVSYSTYGTGGSRGSVSETNATLYSVINTSARSGITIGLRMGTSSGNWNVKTHEEFLSSAGYNQLNNTGYFETWFECNNELGVTLLKGTTYYYQFYVKINGTEYADSIRTFKTKGSGSNDLRGCVDYIGSYQNTVYFGGWAFDWDVPTTALKIQVYIGGPAGSGTCIATMTANEERSDVGDAYSGVGNYHGFSNTITTSLTGNQGIYIYAINAGGGDNNPCIGSGTVNITGDTIKPTVSNLKISDVTNKGYWVTCTVSDNIGVKTVKFKTKISGGSPITTTGTLSGNTAKCYIKASDFTSSSAQFTTDVYAYDAAGNASEYARGTIYIDQDKPTVSDMRIYDVTKDGYWVSCKVSDNIGVTKVKFPTWIRGWSESQIHWLEGTLNGNIATCYVKASDFTTESIRFGTDIRAYDAAGNVSDYARDGVTIDQNAPTISDIQIDTESTEGYTISCKVEDDYSDIAKVCFLTQLADTDVEDDWQENSLTQGTLKNGRYVFDVSYADFDYAIGEYTTSIYTVDTWGNETNKKYTHKVQGDVLDEDMPQEEDIPDGIWIAGLTQQTYSYIGKAIKPEVRVYDKYKLLVSGKDYSISYKNNTKANDATAAQSAPTITVTGKGNYNGKDTVTFVIERKNIANEDIVQIIW